MTIHYINGFITQLNDVLPATGDTLPIPNSAMLKLDFSNGKEYLLTLVDEIDPTKRRVFEIVKAYMDVNGNIKIQRAQEHSVSPSSWPVGTVLYCGLTADILQLLYDNMASLQQQMSEQAQAMSTLQQNVNAFGDTVTSLNQTVTAQEQTISDLNTAVTEQGTALQTAQQTLTQHGQDISNQGQQLQSQAQAVAQVQQDVVDQQTTLDELSTAQQQQALQLTQFGQTLQTVQTTQEEQAEAIADVVETSNLNTQAIGQLTTTVNSHTTALSQLGSLVTNLGQEVGQLQTTQEQHTQKLQELDGAYQQATQDIASIKTRQDAQDETISTLGNELQGVQQTLTGVQETLNTQQQAITEQGTLLGQLQQTVEGFDGRITTVEDLVQQLMALFGPNDIFLMGMDTPLAPVAANARIAVFVLNPADDNSIDIHFGNNLEELHREANLGGSSNLSNGKYHFLLSPDGKYLVGNFGKVWGGFAYAPKDDQDWEFIADFSKDLTTPVLQSGLNYLVWSGGKAWGMFYSDADYPRKLFNVDMETGDTTDVFLPTNILNQQLGSWAAKASANEMTFGVLGSQNGTLRTYTYAIGSDPTSPTWTVSDVQCDFLDTNVGTNDGGINEDGATRVNGSYSVDGNWYAVVMQCTFETSGEKQRLYIFDLSDEPVNDTIAQTFQMEMALNGKNFLPVWSNDNKWVGVPDTIAGTFLIVDVTTFNSYTIPTNERFSKDSQNYFFADNKLYHFTSNALEGGGAPIVIYDILTQATLPVPTWLSQVGSSGDGSMPGVMFGGGDLVELPAPPEVEGLMRYATGIRNFNNNWLGYVTKLQHQSSIQADDGRNFSGLPGRFALLSSDGNYLLVDFGADEVPLHIYSTSTMSYVTSPKRSVKASGTGARQYSYANGLFYGLEITGTTFSVFSVDPATGDTVTVGGGSLGTETVQLDSWQLTQYNLLIGLRQNSKPFLEFSRQGNSFVAAPVPYTLPANLITTAGDLENLPSVSAVSYSPDEQHMAVVLKGVYTNNPTNRPMLYVYSTDTREIEYNTPIGTIRPDAYPAVWSWDSRYVGAADSSLSILRCLDMQNGGSWVDVGGPEIGDDASYFFGGYGIGKEFVFFTDDNKVGLYKDGLENGSDETNLVFFNLNNNTVATVPSTLGDMVNYLNSPNTGFLFTAQKIQIQ